MDLIQGLQQLGLSEYEARAYAALLAHPGVTGYEVARHSGIPRSRVYEALGGLIAKGAAHTSQEGERTLYHPVEHAALLRRYVTRAERAAAELKPLLDEQAAPREEAPLVTVRGYEPLLEQARELVGGAERILFLSGWPREVAALMDDLAAAETRGVAVYALVYGEAESRIRRLFRHPPPALSGRWSWSAPTLVTVADHREALLAEMRPGDAARGLWTRSEGVAAVAAEYVKHDIFLLELVRRLGPEAEPHFRAMADLQRMWFAEAPGTGPDEEGSDA